MKKNIDIQFKESSRRNFIRKGSLLIATAPIGTFLKEQNSEEEEEKVSANEDLMREHGLLQRMMLIYDAAVSGLNQNHDFNLKYINQTAAIIKNFVEDYHEKLEEDYVFPRLEKANRHVNLVSILRTQHDAGRKVTSRILNMTKFERLTETDRAQNLVDLMKAFNSMYRPHESREETVLFPAFKETVSVNEYDSLGEVFEEKEHEKFGEDGFDQMVAKVEEIEKQMGIYELNQFTPKI